jgi:hypothetical protein
MKPRTNTPLITTKPAQSHDSDRHPANGSHPDEVDVQDVPASFHTALGQLLQAVVNRGIKGCRAHSAVFRQAADLLLHPEDHAKNGVCLEVHNSTMWFLLDLNHEGEKFQLQFADYHAPCGGYFLRIPDDPELSPSAAAFILFHIAAVFGDPTVIQGRVINN